MCRHVHVVQLRGLANGEQPGIHLFGQLPQTTAAKSKLEKNAPEAVTIAPEVVTVVPLLHNTVR